MKCYGAVMLLGLVIGLICFFCDVPWDTYLWICVVLGVIGGVAICIEMRRP